MSAEFTSNDPLDNPDLQFARRFLSASIALVESELKRGTSPIDLALLLSTLSVAVARGEPLAVRDILMQIARDLLEDDPPDAEAGQALQ